MTPEGLRADIPATDSVAYFNTGASGPSPRRVVDAICEFQRHHAYEAPAGEGMYPVARDAYADVKSTVADLIGADDREVTLTQSTTEGINLVAGAIDWEPGDTVVRTDVEHASGVLPWRRRRDTHGIDVEVVECDRGRLDVEAFEDAVGDARLVCLSTLSWSYGTRLPVEEVVDLAHEAGALVLLDAVQSPGQAPVDVDDLGADFLVGAGHKWLLGPWGAGFLYVSDAARDRIEPAWIGPAGVEDPDGPGYRYVDGAGMFELTTMQVATYRGLQAAIETIRAVGLGAIQDRIERLTDRLKAGVPDGRLLSPRGYESGLVSFEADDPESFVERAREAGVVLRTIPDPESVRASVHAFNTPDEIDALVDLL